MTPHEERRDRLKAFLTDDEELRELAEREGFARPDQGDVPLRSLLTPDQIRTLRDIRRTFAADPPATGRRLGRYRLDTLLGEGGMGVVFQAVDEELGRKVAIKMLKTARAYSATEMERFQREARNTARLKHPGIATLYELGREGDTVFLALELVEGKPFDPRSGDLPTRIALLEKVARAVQYAHEQGVLHRDLKPGNVLVDARGEPRLLDFGLSRELESTEELTRSGTFFGTAAYAAPEQADGRVRALDARTDVYALGAILYEILSGRVPATGETLAEVLRKVSNEEPPRPPGPPDLANVCLKALEKDPARRYSTAAALADDLARFLRGEPVEAKPASTFARLRKAVAKRRGVLIPAALGAALLAALLARDRVRPGYTFDDFESTPMYWSFVGGLEFPGARGSLELDATVAHGGRRSYRLAADFSGGGQYVGAWRDLPGRKDVEEIRLWVRSAGVARLMVRLTDQTGQCHQKHLALAPGDGWQELSIRTSEIVGAEHWGGANDGRWHGAIRGLGINVHKDAAPSKAAVWLDDIVGHAGR